MPIEVNSRRVKNSVGRSRRAGSVPAIALRTRRLIEGSGDRRARRAPKYLSSDCRRQTWRLWHTESGVTCCRRRSTKSSAATTSKKRLSLLGSNSCREDQQCRHARRRLPAEYGRVELSSSAYVEQTLGTGNQLLIDARQQRISSRQPSVRRGVEISASPLSSSSMP